MQNAQRRSAFEKGSLIEVHSPSEEEIEHLSREFKVSKDLLKDALDPFESPRLELEHGLLYIFVRVPVESGSEIHTTPYLIAVGEDFVMLVSQPPLPFIERLTQDTLDMFTTQKTKLVLQILHRTMRSYRNILINLNKQINSLRLSLHGQNVSNKDILRLIAFEETLNNFLTALTPKASMLNSLLGGKTLSLYEDDKDLIEDLVLNVNELTELSKNSLKTIINTRDAYSTVLTNNLNRVIKLLTSLTIILTIAVIIPGLYGMNVKLPLQNSEHAFSIILGTILLVSLVLTIIFNKNKWL